MMMPYHSTNFGYTGGEGLLIKLNSSSDVQWITRKHSQPGASEDSYGIHDIAFKSSGIAYVVGFLFTTKF